MSGKIHLFSNGSQYMDWDNRNCAKCSKITWDKDGNAVTSCKLYDAICMAAIDAGEVDAETAKRLGYKPGLYTWDCPERDAANYEEWEKREREAIECGLIVPRKAGG
jgi:hypothetical protein